jgi:glycosyltransferase involved in cell wall biosynthesis
VVDPVDVAVVSLGTTPGLRRSDAVFAALVREAGASCSIVPVRIGASGALRRHPAMTDLVESLAARRAGRRQPARTIVYSSVTAALLQRPPGVPWSVRYDSPAALNRPGWGGAWQRARERRVLAAATLLMPLTQAAADATPPEANGVERVLMPVPVEPIEPSAERDLDAVSYAGYPRKRGLELACAAWAQAAGAGQRLVVGGVDRAKALRWLERCGVPEPAGVTWAGEVAREEWLATVGRARLYVNGSRWEEFGIAQLEALAAGTPLATVPTPGPNAALPLARELAPELVAAELSASSLAGAVRAGLALGDAERRDYAVRSRDLLEPFSRDTLRERLATRVLPALGIT